MCCGWTWGNTVRTDWQSFRGTHTAAIRGAWSGLDHGGLWQSVPVQPARPYHLSAHFMWDNDWKADFIELRIEWYDGETKLRVDQRKITHLAKDKWSEKGFDLQAPQNAKKAHVVLDVSGIAEEGVLYVDELALILQ